MNTASSPRALPGPPDPSAAPSRRFAALLLEDERRHTAQTHRLFVWLLALQWIAALGLALFGTPLAWSHPGLSLPQHVIVALAVGAALTLPAIALIRWRPFLPLTRHAIALSQVGFSSLLLYLSGGHTETHFHVFGSLAFIALYREWRLLVTASIFIVLDHGLRGCWPTPALSALPPSTAWHLLEHTIWVFFEGAVLGWACVLSRRAMAQNCHTQDESLRLRETLEEHVHVRTEALQLALQRQEHTAAELRESESHQRALIANIPIGIFESTRAGTVLLANPYILQLIGVDPTTELGRLDLSDGHVLAAHERTRLWAELDAHGETHGFATTLRRADGTHVEVLINARLKTAATPEQSICKGTVEDITARKAAERALETLNHQLLLASRQAGMAEVANGVLHNVGNVLTSVNLIVHDVQDRLKTTRLSHLHRIVEVIERERPRLATFLTTDPAGRQLPDFVAKLDEHLASENRAIRADVEELVRHFEHIREIIVTQQSSTRLLGVSENLAPSQLVEDAIRLNLESFERHGIRFARDFTPVPFVKADRHKVLQILVNLLRNAKDALQVHRPGERLVTLRVAPGPAGSVHLIVSDNGLGIAPEHLARLFQHGFTTKKTGHGFGLHSSVLAAREMGGDLAVASDGSGLGATFTLTLPCAAVPAR